jgi:uncharacterized protein (TIGR03067 family)
MLCRTVLLFSMLALTVGTARADSAAEEAKKLEGSWNVESATYDGKPMPDLQRGQLVFAGNTLILKGVNGREQKLTYRVDPSKNPKTMDFEMEKKEANASPGTAIYEINGDALKLCLGPPDKRPTEFTDKGQILLVLKRKK